MLGGRFHIKSYEAMPFLLWVWLMLCLCIPVSSFAAPSAAESSNGVENIHPPAELHVGNREVATFRATIRNMSPEQRVHAASERMDKLSDRELDNPVTVRESTVGDLHGVAIFLGTTPMFGLLQSDLDPFSNQTLNEAGIVAADNFSNALHALREHRQPETLIRGMALSLAGTMAFIVIAWLILRLKMRISQALARAARLPLDWLVVRGVDMTAQSMKLLQRITVFLLWLLILFVANFWLTFVLRRFPLTEPWGDALAGNLLRLLMNLGRSAINAVPGILIVILIFTITYLIAQILKAFFHAVAEEKISVPFIYPDTAGATRWLVTALLWLLSIAIAYPYIPGSESAAFQGISVIAGLMVTIGSAGIINQAMSGLVLVYSRALNKGERVQIADTEGIVGSVGLLSTKIVTYRNEAVTIPNAVVVGTQIKNYSRLAKDKGATVSTIVSIGYDTSWRQVAAMLIESARRTNGIRHDITPYVMQRELADFYVKYELVACIENPVARPMVLSELHGNIQDVFNEYGVQIMSPNFEGQPEYKVVVPKDKWFMPPAGVESGVDKRA
jgi:small-conductance mechanosensitive channel